MAFDAKLRITPSSVYTEMCFSLFDVETQSDFFDSLSTGSRDLPSTSRNAVSDISSVEVMLLFLPSSSRSVCLPGVTSVRERSIDLKLVVIG